MYKCGNCGHVFEDPMNYIEHHQGNGLIYSEPFSVCPACGEGYVEAQSCKFCGEYHFPEELFDGKYCKECLEHAMNYDNFLEFSTCGVKNENEIDTLEDFIFCMVFELQKAPEKSSKALKKYMKEIYLRCVADEKLLGMIQFKEKIKKYMFDMNLYEDFAEWLTKRRENQRG